MSAIVGFQQAVVVEKVMEKPGDWAVEVGLRVTLKVAAVHGASDLDSRYDQTRSTSILP